MKDKAIKAAMNSIENRMCHVYNQGYEDGLKDGKQSAQIEYEEKQELVEKIKVYYEPVMHKPGYFWLSDRHLQMINIEALAKALKFDQEYPALVDVKEERI